MGWWTLAREGFHEARSLTLVAALVGTAAVVRSLAPAERHRLRSVVVLTGLHVGLVLTAALLGAEGLAGAARGARLASHLVEVAAFVGLAGLLLFPVALGRLRVEPPRILQDLAIAAAVIAAGLFVAAQSGYSLSGVITTSAVITAVVGFSLQDTLGNVMGGVALQLDHSVRVGEWIKVGDVGGRVAEIRWRYTSIMTRNGELVLLPNSVLMKSQVTVLARGLQPGRWRRWLYFHVDFKHQPTDVIEAVESALRSAPIPLVAAEPAPQCLLMDIGECQCRYAVRYWLTDPAVDDPTDSVVRTRVYFALARARIHLAVPAHGVRISREGERADAEKARDEHGLRVQALKRVEVLRSLDEADLDHLARELRYAPFAAGEVMTRQGAEGHWLYIVTEGTASVRVSVEGGFEREVARLGPGRFFGEISLMTGRPREATVVAVTDVECYRLGADAFRHVLGAHPEKADDFAAVLAERLASVEAARKGLDDEARARAAAEHRADLGTRIREFFGLD